MRSKQKKVYGVGVNDADYGVCRHEVQNGKARQVWCCPIYRRWKGLLQRCYSEKFQKKQPRYKGCVVCDEWLVFSNFKRWMESQDWQGKELDKDILFRGNKLYSPETCVFVGKDLNRFLTSRGECRGRWPVGVHWCERDQCFIAQINDPFLKKRKFIGAFDCPEEAHGAWKEEKHRLSCMYAGMALDYKLKEALRGMYQGSWCLDEWRTERANQRREAQRYGS